MADSSSDVWPPKCRFGARCWRPACAYHHEESDERRQHLAQLASFWAGCAPCGGHVQSNVGLAECLADVSCLREVVKKLAASIKWSSGALHLSSNVGINLPAEVGSGGVHVTGKEGGTPCRVLLEPHVRMFRQHSSSRSAKQDPLWNLNKSRPQPDDGLGNKDVLSDAGESAALPRSTTSGPDLPSEREYPPDGKHSGLVSSLVYVGRVTLVHKALGMGWNRH